MRVRVPAAAALAVLALAAAGRRLAAAPPQAPDSLRPVGAVPEDVRAGELIAVPIQIRHQSRRPGIVIRLRVASGEGSAEGDAAETDASGVATFDSLRLFGPPGQLSIVFTDGVSSLTTRVRLARGLPRARIIRQPSPRIAIDSAFHSQPLVRVADAADNPIVADVEVRLCRVDDGRVSCASDASGRAALEGTTVVRANKDGLAEFTNLAFNGPAGLYRLAFSVVGVRDAIAGDTSDVMRYDPSRDFNRSYVVISAIKSIAGRMPRGEFFDARFRFRFGPHLFSLASFDVSLVGRGTDSVRSEQELLNEAFLSLNQSLFTPEDPTTNRPERSLYWGGQVRIFNTLPYWGAHLGSVEHAGSAFQGSSFTFAVLRRVTGQANEVDGDSLRAERWNLFADFFLRSSVIPFFETLNLRGGVLLPLAGDRRVRSRIAISVPVGTIHFF